MITLLVSNEKLSSKSKFFSFEVRFNFCCIFQCEIWGLKLNPFFPQK
jgi:hypothetical protein